ncbi:MAG: SRPBCC family protein, partial [Ktedonobacterales bacterium]
VEEAVRVASLRGRARWIVRERDAPFRWVLRGEVWRGLGSGTLTYTLTPVTNGTLFEREFVYPIPLLFAPLDQLYVRRRIQAESTEAMRRLGKLLEFA